MNVKELVKKTINRTSPLMMSIAEPFDVGLNTRTGVDHSYELPFKFTGMNRQANLQTWGFTAVRC